MSKNIYEISELLQHYTAKITKKILEMNSLEVYIALLVGSKY